MPYDGNRSDDKPVLPNNWRGSTALNSTIKSYEDLAYRVKVQLGFPTTQLEISDEQIAIFIDEAVEWYSQYSGRETQYIVFTDAVYVAGCGVKLDDIVKNTSMPDECFQTTSAISVTGSDITYDTIGGTGNTVAAYLSVSPFLFPDVSNNPTISAQGQNIVLKFDENDPWDASAICNANCFTIKPSSSDCASLSSNSNLDNINFTSLILTYPSLSSLLNNPTVSADDDGIVPISSLDCEVLSAIPTSWFDLSSFYASADLVGFPVEACVTIRNGQGIIYPNCSGGDGIDSCLDLSANWTIDDDFDWTVASGMVSGEDGRVIPFSALDLSSANSVSIPGLPICNIDGVVPLNENNGRYATFHVCNSALDTDGNWPVSNVQFKTSYIPPEDVMEQRFCGVQNKGFTINKTLTAVENCIPNTPSWIPVDIEFESTTTTDLTGTVVSCASGNYDSELGYRRKVIDVFSIDYTMGNGGYFGSNLLFSFDYGVVANAFGYDLQGNRNLYRNGYDMLSYHMARGFIDEVRRYVNYVSYEFNPDTQYLKVTPEPYSEASTAIRANRAYVIGAYVEKPLEHIINKKWVQEWTKAKVMETLGMIRSKYGNVTLYGGSSIQGDTLVSMGREEQERLLRELRDDNYYTEPPMFVIG